MDIVDVKRVVILGRSASGKSTLAACRGNLTGLPVIELDRYFWRSDLVPAEPDRWISMQQKLIAEYETWIMDGDLGPLDAVEARLRAADTVIVLDFSLLRCGVACHPPVTGARGFLAVGPRLSPP